MKSNQLERQFINGVDEWSGLVGFHGVGHQGNSQLPRQAKNNSNQFHFMKGIDGIVCGERWAGGRHKPTKSTNFSFQFDFMALNEIK